MAYSVYIVIDALYACYTSITAHISIICLICSVAQNRDSTNSWRLYWKVTGRLQPVRTSNNNVLTVPRLSLSLVSESVLCQR